MKLALVGYGKMGRMIESLAPQYGFNVGLILDEHNNQNGSGLTPENFRDINVAIEFTSPEVVIPNLQRLMTLRTPTVTGTTGWNALREEVRQLVENNAAALVYASNFSIGVNLFEKLVADAGKLFNAYPEYGAWAWEIHHSAKKDAPSGTLLTLVDAMKKAGYTLPVDQSSSRAGSVPGTHEIGFDSQADTITLRHTARSREGFARGALHAARWLAEDPSGRGGFREFREILFGGR
jgi:4-hydroxy-tetrahydrodipicolinate reductase